MIENDKIGKLSKKVWEAVKLDTLQTLFGFYQINNRTQFTISPELRMNLFYTRFFFIRKVPLDRFVE